MLLVMQYDQAKVDPDIAKELLQLSPSLLTAGELVTMARKKKAKFPIRGCATLAAFLDKGGAIRLPSGYRLTAEQIDEFMPAAFFPIVDELDFMTKLYVALERGREVHLAEEKLEHMRQSVAKKACR